ncbi:hypothetical protein N752_20840 [Desulforamulus aquiferis]|nr:hypothetical protein N752_20840 [Desulforamulus aquiferis]
MEIRQDKGGLHLKAYELLRSVKGYLSKMFKKKGLLLQLLQSSSLLQRLELMLKQRSNVLLLYVDVVDFHQVLQVHGEALARRILNVLRTALHRKAGDFLNCSGEISVENLWGDDFWFYVDLILFPPLSSSTKCLQP